MKKLFTLKVVMMMFLIMAGFTKTSAKASWVGNSAINVNGTWYYAGTYFDWCESGAFNDADLGTITSLTIGGQSQIWDNNSAMWADGSTMIMGYKIDDGVDHEFNLIRYAQSGNNNVFQSGGSTFTSEVVDISGLSVGTHTIYVYFGHRDDNAWDGGNNYHATFTIPANQSVTVTSAGYATLVSGLNLDYSSTAIKAYTAKVNTENGKVVLTPINKVPANTPVVLYKEGGATNNIPVATSTDTPAASDLVAGTGAAIAYSEGGNYNYILNNVNGIGFYKANDKTVATDRAYLQTTYNVEDATSARMMMVFADDVTGIEAVKSSESVNGYYNLAGQRVAQPTKGLYIVNGKKVIKK